MINIPFCASAMSSALTLALDTLLQHSGMLYFCHASNSRRYIKPLDLPRLFSLNSALTSTTPLQHWPSPSPLLLLEVSCPVDCCRSCTALLMSTKRTAAFPWRSQDHCSRTCSPTNHQYCRNISGLRHLHRNNFGCQRHLPRNISVAQVTSC